jgi:hypothetical protein
VGSQHIGIAFRSVVSFEMQGGFGTSTTFERSFGPPVIEAPAWKNGQFEATIVSERDGRGRPRAEACRVGRALDQWRPLRT